MPKRKPDPKRRASGKKGWETRRKNAARRKLNEAGNPGKHYSTNKAHPAISTTKMRSITAAEIIEREREKLDREHARTHAVYPHAPEVAGFLGRANFVPAPQPQAPEPQLQHRRRLVANFGETLAKLQTHCQELHAEILRTDPQAPEVRSLLMKHQQAFMSYLDSLENYLAATEI